MRKRYQVLCNGTPVPSVELPPVHGYQLARLARHDYMMLRAMRCPFCSGYPKLVDTDLYTVCGSCLKACRATIAEVSSIATCNGKAVSS